MSSLFFALLEKIIFFPLSSPYLLMKIFNSLPCCILSLESALQGWFLKIPLSLEVVQHSLLHHEVLEP